MQVVTKKKISLISHTNVRKEILITHMANQSNTKRKTDLQILKTTPGCKSLSRKSTK